MTGEGREGGEGRGEEAFLLMWPRRLSPLNPPLTAWIKKQCLHMTHDQQCCPISEVTAD